MGFQMENKYTSKTFFYNDKNIVESENKEIEINILLNLYDYINEYGHFDLIMEN